MLLVTGAPAWAEGKNRPGFDKAHAGTWKPNAKRLGDFGTAIAKRYSGNFDPDGALGQPALPRVREFQLWAEPNLATYLTPQYKRRNAWRATTTARCSAAFTTGSSGRRARRPS